jgi:3-oxoadipate enol-lactonase
MPRGELNGWSYSYTDEGSGPPLIFNHGILMDSSIWDAQIEDLKDSYRCVAIDAPGHGESVPVAMGIDFYEYADMLTAAAGHLGIDQAVWIGQSMGGFINLRLALRHPDRVKGLVLIDTQAHSEDPGMRAQYEAFLKVALEDGVGEDLANVLTMLLFGPTFAGKPESDVWRKKLMTADIEGRHAMVRAVFDRDDVHGRLGEIRAPAIVIHGREDVAIEAERAEELARDLPDATIELLDECGHCSPHEAAAALTPHIRSFLERIGY